jgi:O-antigen/teichoic acid export membrane protein
MTDIRAAMSWLLPYVASVALTKGVALITLPLLTSHLAPADFGRLELVVSVIEVAGLVLCFSAADLLFRFAGTPDIAESRRNAAAIAGGALALSLIVGGILQIGLYLTRNFIEGAIDVNLLAIGLLCASFSALIELPLAWLRSNGSATTFLYYVGARSLAQTGMMALTLTQGYGAFAVIAGNAAVDGFFSIALLWRQARETGLRYDPNLLARAARYGWPLLGGGLAMFILGNCDRWFLAAAISSEALAHYALAAKLATIVALAMQPFGLWWNARRMRVLQEPDGKRRSAEAVAWGFACLAIGAIWVALVVPAMIEFALPSAYAPSIKWLPWLVLIVAVNETSALLNVSAYIGKRATAALIVNGCGALTALVGYLVLAPEWGVAGAIAATIAGHGVRIVAYGMHGARYAPIPYRWVAMAGMGALAFSTIQAAQALDATIARIILMLLSSLAIIALAAIGRNKAVLSVDASPA